MNEREMPVWFGGGLWADQTVVHPLGAAILAACIIALFLLPRRNMIFPFLFLAVAIPSAQRFSLAGLDFSFLRVLILATLAIALARGHNKKLKLFTPDYFILLWAIWSIIANAALVESASGAITRIGSAIDTVGAYFIARIYIAGMEDLRRVVTWLGAAAIPILCFFLVEWSTGKNQFAVFGGVPEETITRNGRLRCQGPFSHPIMAGVFWASLAPLLLTVWKNNGKGKFYALFGFMATLVIVLSTASSTPVLTLAIGVAGVSIYFLHRYLAHFFWIGVAALVSISILMDAPIWHLMARIDLAGGSTGWHRYNLIDQFINRFSEWWFVGIQHTGHWGWGLQDLTNQYVAEGVRGGLLQLLLFCAFVSSLLLALFRRITQSISVPERRFAWACFITFCAHGLSFLAVSYFGQTNSLFFVFSGAFAAIAFTQSSQPARGKPVVRAEIDHPPIKAGAPRLQS